MDIQDTSFSQDIQDAEDTLVAPVILVTKVACSTNDTDIQSIEIPPRSFRACFEILKAGPFENQPFSDVEPNSDFQKGIGSR